jgi:endoglucanase
VLLGVVDPGDNYAFEVHEYLDSDYSGTHPSCVSGTFGSEGLKGFNDWLHTNNKRGFLGEFGGSSDATCLAAVDDMLGFIDQNKDAWLGWTWWSAGPWWGSYMFSVEPQNGMDAAQLATLVKHL